MTNRKNKKQISKKQISKKQISKKKQNLFQRGGSGHGSSRTSGHPSSSRRPDAGGMPYAFFKLKNEVEDIQFAEQFPTPPKNIPEFNINVSVQEVRDLTRIFTKSPTLDNLIRLYEDIHEHIKEIEPSKIRQRLLDANGHLEKLRETLIKKYITPVNKPKGTTDKEMETLRNADAWCDYIKKLIDSNNKNILEITEFIVFSQRHLFTS